MNVQAGYSEMTGDDSVRDEVMLNQLPQVRYIARRIHERLPQHVPIEDLIHAGVVGLIDAVQRYDHRKNVQLKSYAAFRIRGAILDSLRDLDWSPRDLRRKARLISDVSNKLGNELGRPATEQEVADGLGMELSEFQRMLTEIGGLELNSLQDELSVDGTGEDVPGDPDQSPFTQCLRSETRQRLSSLIAELSEKEQQVLALYYYEELTMKEVGEVLGIGESRVSQIHSMALARLRSQLQGKRQ